MTTLKNKQVYSRRKARKIVKDYYHIVLMPRHHHVHHKDGDPFNNDFDNLEIKNADIHIAEHMRLLWLKQKESIIIKALDRLESQLIVHNTFGYGF